MIFKGYKRINGKRNRGLTLIETLTALTLLMMSIAGPLVLAARSLTFATFAKNEIAAFYLAQEGVEMVRNVRDKNLKNGEPWNSYFGGCKDSDNKRCVVDIWTVGKTSMDINFDGSSWLTDLDSHSVGIKECPKSDLDCQKVKYIQAQILWSWIFKRDVCVYKQCHH
ncbi:MAG: hypothetical protein WC797_02560 [Candidatus Paceibacterota bacterium]|jgi:Tfp pilus assembly protein PilV